MKMKHLLFCFLAFFITKSAHAQTAQPASPELRQRLQQYVAANRLYSGSTYIYFDSVTKKPYRFSPKDFVVEDLSQPPKEPVMAAKGNTGNQLRGTAGNFHLVKDVNALTDANPTANIVSSSINSPFTVMNDVAYFSANDGIHGIELWRSNGTAEGTYLVKDLAPGTENIFIYNIITSNDNILFLCYNYATSEYELLKSDGTAQGTSILKIFAVNYAFSTYNLCDVNGVVYFSITNTASAKEQLWKSDNTEAGTVLVKDFDKGSNLHAFVAANGLLFFTASDAVNGAELWRSNGTDTGTYLLKDVNPGNNSYYYGPLQLTAYNNKLYFSESGIASGGDINLWISDGTSEGTRLAPGHNDVRISNYNVLASLYVNEPFVISQNALYILSYQVATGLELYTYNASDTAAGLHLVEDLHPGTENTYLHLGDMVDVNGIVYFFESDNSGVHLYKTNGTSDSTLKVIDFASNAGVSSLHDGSGKLYFSLFDPIYGYEPWNSDGTESGTVLLEDIYPSSVNSNPINFTSCNHKVVFTAVSDKYGSEIFSSTGSGAQLVKDINTTSSSSSNPNYIIAYGDGVIASAYTYDKGTELWKATSNDATLGKDLVTGQSSGSPTFFTARNNLVYFTADSLINQIPYISNVYKTDGTPEGTVRITSNKSDRVSSFAVTDNGTVFYTIIGAFGNTELWKSDSTSAGTALLHTFSSVWASYDYRLQRYITIIAIENTVYLNGTDNTTATGNELWKSDGTIAGTVMVKDIYVGANSSTPQYLTAYNGEVYFSGNDGTGNALWKSDGTETGTIKLKTVAITSSPTIVGNILYFNGNDDVTGFELWKTNGTPEGTILVKDIYAGAIGSSPNNLIDVNGTLFFFTYDLTLGTRLWKSNGTADNTMMIKVVDTGTVSLGFPVVAANKLFFTVFGKLWTSDGTSEGTGIVADEAGNIVAVSSGLTASGNRLFFQKYDYEYGYEIWTADATQVVLPVNILSFTASLQGVNVIAQWQTSAEVSTAYFNVQRNTDGVHFTNIGKVTATGNSNAMQQYSFDDINIANLVAVKTIYYRLEIVDKDGAATYSKVVPVDLKWKDVLMVLHPNPAKNYIKIRIDNFAGNVVFDVYDMSGKKVKTIQQYVQNGNDITLNITAFKAGVYTIKVSLNNKTLQQQFIKE